jgi:hypothetical protein
MKSEALRAWLRALPAPKTPQQSPILFDHFIGMSEQSLRDVRSKALAAVRFLRPAWSRLFYKAAMNVTLVRSYVTFTYPRSTVRHALLTELATDGDLE